MTTSNGLPPRAAHPQAGGSPDFDTRWTELREWPDHYIAEVHSGSMFGSHDRNGERPEGEPGSFRDYMPTSWCVVVKQSGWGEPRSWLNWAATIREAADGLAEWMRERRIEPHLGHIEDHEYIDGCEDCAQDLVRFGAAS